MLHKDDVTLSQS